MQLYSSEIISYPILEKIHFVSRFHNFFNETIKFDKKVDPKKLKFGSKIDNADIKNEKYYTINEILSPPDFDTIKEVFL